MLDADPWFRREERRIRAKSTDRVFLSVGRATSEQVVQSLSPLYSSVLLKFMSSLFYGFTCVAATALVMMFMARRETLPAKSVLCAGRVMARKTERNHKQANRHTTVDRKTFRACKKSSPLYCSYAPARRPTPKAFWVI